jgi:hypothetical protein
MLRGRNLSRPPSPGLAAMPELAGALFYEWLFAITPVK